MVRYKRNYIEFFGYDEFDFIPSEVDDQSEAVEFHHLTRRGKGKHAAWNLAAVTRSDHDKAEGDSLFNHELKIIHARKCIDRIAEGLGLNIEVKIY